MKGTYVNDSGDRMTITETEIITTSGYTFERNEKTEQSAIQHISKYNLRKVRCAKPIIPFFKSEPFKWIGT